MSKPHISMDSLDADVFARGRLLGAADESFIEHRLAVGEALVHASHLLLTSRDRNIQQALRVVGEATVARRLVLSVSPTMHRDRGMYEGLEKLGTFEWSSGEPPAEATREPRKAEQVNNGHRPDVSMEDEHDEPSTLSFPIVSASGQLLGCLDFEYEDQASDYVGENARVLSILSNLFAGYFERRMAERSLRASKERFQRLIEEHPMPILVLVDGQILFINQAGAELLGFRSAPALLGRTYLDFVPADLFGTLEERWQAVRQGADAAPLTHKIIRQDGEERIVESLCLSFDYEGQSSAQIILRDITEQWRSEERYRAFVETTSQAFWHIKLDHSLDEAAPFEEQLAHLWEHARLVECNAELRRLLGVGGNVCVVGRKLRSLLAPAGQQLVADFVQDGYQFKNKEYTAQREGKSPRHFVINAVCSDLYGGRLNIWGTCVEVTEQIELERRMVTVLEEQQERIGRDLHDGIGQLLTGMRILSSNLAARHFAEGQEGHRQAQKIVGFAEEASRNVRDLYRGLAPRRLINEGLAEALDELTESVNALSGTDIVFVHDGVFDVIDQDAKLQLYRIVQEATNNALKHAEASNVWVHLTRTEGKIVLQVEDDGKGFDPDQKTNKSLGFYSMRYRARSIRADLNVETKPGEGTIVRVVLPIAVVGEEGISESEGH